MKFSDQLRRLIETSGESRYSICKATGLQQATLTRFMQGKGGLSVDGLDKLAKHLGWEVKHKGK